MSLPQATKDVSGSPRQHSVVDPVDKQAQAADIDRKLRFYGVIQAFRQGRLPSNRQIDDTLGYVLEHSPVSTEKLSPEGQTLVQDVRDIISTVKEMLNEKNADELLQNFIWHTQTAAKDDSTRAGNVLSEALSTAPVDSDRARADGEDAVKHLRTILTLILTNSEVRKLIADFSLIGRDLLSIGAAKAVKTISPDPNRLAEVDQPAPSDQFITEGGRVAGPNETPVFEGKIPGTGKKIRHHPKEDTAFVQSEDAYGAEARRPVGEVAQENREQYQGAKQRALQEGVGLGQEAADRARRHAQEYHDMDQRGDETGKEQKKSGMVGKMKEVRDTVRDGFNERMGQERKDTANDHFERGKHFFSEEYFPEERRSQFIFRAKKVILECQRHDDYQQSMRWLLNYIEEYTRHGRVTSQSASERAKQTIPADKDHPIKLATLELRTLLERFANNSSMDMIFDAVDALIDDTRRDEGLRDWFRSVNAYFRRVLLEPGYILESDCNDRARSLREDGRQYYDVKYREHFDNLSATTGEWFNAMGEDRLNKQFGNDWARLTKDLLFDHEGSLKYKPELWNDVRRVIVPQLIQKVGYIPIPRIEYTDDMLDLVIENLTLQGRNLFPNIVSVDVHNYVKFSPYDAISDESHHKISFTLQHIQADMRDVAFYYNKKTGIPKMSDSGLADVLIGGEGVTAHVTLQSSTRDKSSVFTVQDINVKVDNIKFSIRDSKHDFLYKTLRPLATGMVRRQIQKAIRDGLRTGLEYIDGQLVGVKNRMESAKETDGKTRADVLMELFNRSKAAAEDTDARTSLSVERGGVGASMRMASSTGSSSGANKQFKIVGDKDHSLLSNVGNPAGWVDRADERDTAVGKKTPGVVGRGDEGWRSDAFSITPGHHSQSGGMGSSADHRASEHARVYPSASERVSTHGPAYVQTEVSPKAAPTGGHAHGVPAGAAAGQSAAPRSAKAALDALHPDFASELKPASRN